MKIKEWSVWHGNDGWSVGIYYRPLWKKLGEELLYAVDDLTGDRLCGAGWSERAWDLEFGKVDKYGDRRSIPSECMTLFNNLVRKLDSEEVARFPISKKLGLKLSPRLAFLDEEA